MAFYSSLIDYFSKLDATLLKIGCAVFAGAVLGLEREYTGHAAGLRTIILVCLAPALAVLVCGEFFDEKNSLARIAPGLFTGVGFIGGGVILKHGNSETVRGVTTAAVLWTATTLGFVFGLGMYFIGFLGLGVAFFVVYVLYPVTRLFHTRRHANIIITAASGEFSAKKGIELLKNLGLVVTVGGFDFNAAAGTQTFTFSISYRTRDLPEIPGRVRDAFTMLPGILQIRWN